ncbi:YEATS domain-containing protein 2 [Phlyctochytrium planicorne]|nr:YEATS domain-containing protein 2 [Phlyctochytrium planicorne]
MEREIEVELVWKERERHQISEEIRKAEDIIRRYVDIPKRIETVSSSESGFSDDIDGLIAQRYDGATVKVICPDCGRSDFSNVQGFVNHCLNKHDRSYSSHMVAISECGQILALVFITQSVPRNSHVIPDMQIDEEVDIVTVEPIVNRIFQSRKRKRAGKEEVHELDVSTYDIQQKEAQLDQSTETVTQPVPRTQMSRFHVKRRIIVGNTSRFLKRGTSGVDEFLWTVYLHGPISDVDISPFVKRVTFHLHEDYKPYNIIVMDDPPFKLSRFGWGESSVRIRLEFIGDQNEPVDIVYTVKLDRFLTGKEVFGGEAWLDIELDRKTIFGPTRIVERPSDSFLESDEDGRYIEGDLESQLDNILPSIISEFPPTMDLDLPFANSAPLTWNDDARNAVEYARAQQLLREVQLRNPSLEPNVIEIVEWCRRNNHATKPVEKRNSIEELYQLCELCGFSHGREDYCKDVVEKLKTEGQTSITGLKPLLQYLERSLKARQASTHESGLCPLAWKRKTHSYRDYVSMEIILAEIGIKLKRLMYPLPGEDSPDQNLLGMLIDTMRAFLKDLIAASAKLLRNRATEFGAFPSQKLTLMPIHVYAVLSRHDHFDFLLSSHLAFHQ